MGFERFGRGFAPRHGLETINGTAYLAGIPLATRRCIGRTNRPLRSLRTNRDTGLVRRRRMNRIFCRVVRMDCISAIGRSTLLIEQKDVPIGDAYRERVKGYVSRLAVL